MNTLRSIIYVIAFFLFSLIHCSPIQISIADTIKPYITNEITILQVDTISNSSYGDGVMYRIRYRYSK
jgi:hypothetical protein